MVLNLAKGRRLEAENRSLRAEIDRVRGCLMRYGGVVLALVESCEAVIDGVDMRKSRRHTLIGGLQAHKDHVLAVHQELAAVAFIASLSNEPQMVKRSLLSAVSALTLVGVTTAGLSVIGLLADVKTLLPDMSDNIDRVVDMNVDLQIDCSNVVVRIEENELDFPTPAEHEGEHGTDLADALIKALRYVLLNRTVNLNSPYWLGVESDGSIRIVPDAEAHGRPELDRGWGYEPAHSNSIHVLTSAWPLEGEITNAIERSIRSVYGDQFQGFVIRREGTWEHE